jgi:hypothetical protein
MALTKDASTTIQGPEKEGKRFSGKQHSKMVRISEEVQNSEWPRGRTSRAPWEIEANRQETVEVYSLRCTLMSVRA